MIGSTSLLSNTPPTPGGGNRTVFTSLYFLGHFLDLFSITIRGSAEADSHEIAGSFANGSLGSARVFRTGSSERRLDFGASLSGAFVGVERLVGTFKKLFGRFPALVADAT